MQKFAILYFSFLSYTRHSGKSFQEKFLVGGKNNYKYAKIVYHSDYGTFAQILSSHTCMSESVNS